MASLWPLATHEEPDRSESAPGDEYIHLGEICSNGKRWGVL
jgi:hypothetical protein